MAIGEDQNNKCAIRSKGDKLDMFDRCFMLWRKNERCTLCNTRKRGADAVK